jgi:predicted histone-like DNA-binding protein
LDPLFAPGGTIVTVKFNVVEHGKPANPAAPTKFYPSLVASGRVSLRQLAEEIAQISTLSSTDTVAMLEALLVVIPGELAKGNVVELGDFGNFWLKANSRGSDSPDDVDATQIVRLLPRFNPGKEFKRALGTVEFEKASTKLKASLGRA